MCCNNISTVEVFHCQSMTIYMLVSSLSHNSDLIFHPSLTLRVTVSAINVAHHHRYPSSPTPVILDQRSFWMIYNTRFPLCLSNETMIHSGFYHLVWFVWKVLHPRNCGTKPQILLKLFYFPLHFHHVCHHRPRHTTGIYHYVFNVHMTGYC